MQKGSLKKLTLLASSALAFSLASVAQADTYELTVTNLTRGESFTPRIAFVHTGGNAFTVGQPAIEQLAIIAESGNVAPMMTLLETAPEVVTNIVVMDGLLAPGATETITVEGNPGDKVSLLNMLIPSNDAFLAVDAVELPTMGSVTVDALVYDAGSEPNDELCANIPGPTCGGEGDSPNVDGEGYIHIHAGIHGIGDLMASDYDWRNPGARIVITKQ